MHASTLDAVEYLPTAHAVHVVAPLPAPLSVIEPAAHSVHDATLDTIEYVPVVHAVHELAPVPVPVSVTEPASHRLQKVAPSPS
jgi:hypothetical protein